MLSHSVHPHVDEPAPRQPEGDAAAWLEVGHCHETVVISIHGPLDADGCVLLDAALSAVIKDRRSTTVAVDLSAVQVDGEALAILITAGRRAQRNGIRFVVLQPAPETAKALGAANGPALAEIVDHRTLAQPWAAQESMVGTRPPTEGGWKKRR